MSVLTYGPDEATGGLWVHLEQDGDALSGVSRELLGKARELADELKLEVTALALGDSPRELPGEAVACGADIVIRVNHQLLAPYTTDAHNKAVHELVMEGKPEILLFGATVNGRDLASRLAVRLRTGLTADCTDLTIDSESSLLVGEVVGFGGGIVALILCEQRRPQMATVRPGVFAPPVQDASRKGEIRTVTIELLETDLRVKVESQHMSETTDITSAERLVVAGAGASGEFALLEELATLLDGEIGVTRPVVDAGWTSHDRQIGQTGYATRPKLAIVCGVSGAQQFTVGIDGAETVVAVNIDEEAPIFQVADYCIVGDLFNVLPPFLDEVRAALNTPDEVTS